MTEPEPRIAPLSPEELSDDAMDVIAAVMQAQALPSRQDVPEFIATMLRHRTLFQRQADLSAALFAGALPFRLTELVLLRTAWLCQGGYVWGHHSQLAQKSCGFSPEDIEAIIAGSSAPGWDELDRAVLRAVEELQETSTISDETWGVLARHLDDRQLIELPILVGQMHGVIYTQNALRARLMPGSLGLAAR
ncbi:MAG: carboxymuconolactone decarboxylase family protein [Novosphingobium sp.]